MMGLVRLHFKWLSNEAKWRRAKLGGPGATRRLGQRIGWLATALVTQPVALLWIFGGSLALLMFGPSHWVLDAVRTPRDARGFLSILWQVQAVFVGLSVAVVVLVLEVFSAIRLGRRLSETVRETGLLSFVYLGVSNLALVAVALLGIGSGAPGGWAATLVIGLSGLQALLLLVLLEQTLKAVDPGTVSRRRARRAESELFNYVDDQVLERLCVSILEELASQFGFAFEWVLFRINPAWSTVRSPRNGEVRDIHLWRLEDASYRALRKTGGKSRLTLLVRMGQRVGRGSPLIAIPPGMPWRVHRLAKRVVRL